jgi:tRNA 2-thiouridine synthesizing protein A
MKKEIYTMATVELDTRGLKCPVPVLKMTGKLVKNEVKPGDILAVTADCPTFEKDVREWCQKMKKVIIVIKDVAPNGKRAEVRI